jgi:hypothetical protein
MEEWSVMGQLSPKEVEQMLGRQYAEVLQNNPNAQAVYKDCKQVLDTTMAGLEHYNKMMLSLRNLTTARRK